MNIIHTNVWYEAHCLYCLYYCTPVQRPCFHLNRETNRSRAYPDWPN